MTQRIPTPRPKRSTERRVVQTSLRGKDEIYATILRCLNCEHDNPSDNTFCGGCGLRLKK